MGHGHQLRIELHFPFGAGFQPVHRQGFCGNHFGRKGSWQFFHEFGILRMIKSVRMSIIFRDIHCDLLRVA